MALLQHECGIAALYHLDGPASRLVQNVRPEQISRLMPNVLLDLQNRGQLAAGKQGAGLAILTEAHSSPTLAAQLAKVRSQWPNAKVYRWDAVSRDNELDGNALAFGRPLASSLETKSAKIIVALDADLFHAHPQAIRNARGFADGRNPDGGAEIKRLYAVESAYSITGAKALRA